ncbi:alpha/beta fold hydrolase [Alteromonas sp. ASW11-130]|uniref:alpha/beta fold hydrolase n=1 Tax=Alteromonas sp. ASW11-130 TaxID=3015775 RepID=UPI002241F941|nr:alpha/beta hydrolase [Alteromonas sp. ASW11-130]MCW8090598.1 alpha/beta hydrolase [Alteromonas sp. ASW11-130]
MTSHSDKLIPVQFVHANGFPFGSYRALVDAVSDNICISGKEKYGHEPHLPVTNNWPFIVKEVLEQIDENSASYNKTFLVGHSFGAVVSYMAACLAPEKVAGLIMLDPPLVTGWRRYLIKLLKKTPWIDKVTPAGLAQTRNISWPHSTDMVDYFSAKTLFSNMDRRCIEDYVRSATNAEQDAIRLTFSHEVEASIFRNVADNLNYYAGKLQCPSLLVTGESSTVCMPAMRDVFVKQNALKHIITRGGHMFPLEYPEHTAKLIEAILTQWYQESSQ